MNIVPLIALICLCSTTDTCQLRIELLDGTTDSPLPGLVRATRANGAGLTLSGLLERATMLPPRTRERRWHVVLGPVTVSVPQEVLSIEAFHGIETEIARRELDLRGRKKATIRLPLLRFHDAAGRGHRGGNTHLHLMNMTREEADRYLREVPRADGTDLVFISYLERLKDDLRYISNSFTDDDLRALSGGGLLLGNGEEHRNNFGGGGEGYGHVMFLNIRRLIQPVSIGPGISGHGTDGIPMQRGIETARGQGATVIWCHNTFGLEDVPDFLAGIVDAQNIFDGGPHGTYRDSFYRYLNIGLRVPFSTGTDWFIYDFSRAYVEVDGELTVQKWLHGLAAGRSFITNGTFLTLEVNGKRPGDMIAAAGTATLEIEGRGTGRNDFARIELVHNGEVIHAAATAAVAGHHEAALSISVAVDSSGWFALRIPQTGDNELGNPLFAHTSPVYVEIGSLPIFDRAVARELIAEMEQSMITIGEKGAFANAREWEMILDVYRRGIAQLKERLAES